MTPAPNKVVDKQRAQNGTGKVVPARAKAPMDHQPAKEDVTGPRDTVIVWPPLEAAEDGQVSREYLIAGESLDDAELIEYLTDQNFIGALRSMLGDEQWAAYKDNHRNEKGKVTASGCAEFLNYVMEQVKRGNS
jgi:hypothetical protein